MKLKRNRIVIDFDNKEVARPQRRRKSGRGIGRVLLFIAVILLLAAGAVSILTAPFEPAGNRLPIIALTAKAMKADRDHCLEVGASDYISKPLDIDQLFSLLRVWLYRQDENQ